MRFNMKLGDRRVVKNHEGAKAWKMTPELELYAAVVASTLDTTFYEKNDHRLQRIRDLIKNADSKFVAKLAVYAREKMYLRTLPLVLAVELAKVHNGDNLVSRTVSRVIQRADEITELLAYYQFANTRKGLKRLNKLSKQVQKGLAEAFNRFDEYQFAKYNRKAEIRLRDALFLVHPKAVSEEKQTLFDKIASNSLTTPYTWEVEMSKVGQGAFQNEKNLQEAKREKWEEMIQSGRMGYMAMLRNLRNFLENEVSNASLDLVASILADPKRVARSKQLPFRFLAAYREIKGVASGGTSLILEALEDAIAASAQNLKGFDRETSVLIAVDMSGSMQSPISAKSSIHKFEVGLILAMILQSRCRNVISGLFGDRWKIVNMPRKQILANANSLGQRIGEVGHSTNGYLVLQDLIDRKKVVDKIMIFTDLQLWDSKAWGTQVAISDLWKTYKQIAPNAKIYLFDLAGYGQTPLDVRNGDTYLIAGWSDKVFDVMEAIEQGSDAVAEIKKIEL